MFRFLKNQKNSTRSTFLILFLIIASILLAYGFIFSYHKETSKQFINDFASQNATSISAGDTYELVFRLNQLSNNKHWKCISVEESGKTIFTRNHDNDCDFGLFQTKESIISKENKKLKIIFTIELPKILKQMLFLFALIQLTILGTIIFVQRSEFLKREYLTKSWQNKMREIIAQVVHDIRSPLAALKFISKDVQSNYLFQKKQSLLVSSIQRVDDILEDLALTKNDDIPFRSLSTQFISNIHQIINNVINEKETLLYSLGKKIKISNHITNLTSDFIIENLSDKDLYRIISNLINNAIESFDGSEDTFAKTDEQYNIHISLNLDSQSQNLDNSPIQIILSIRDNGIGMSNEQVQKILSQGGSFRKKDGQGLGLKHAIKTIQEAKGHLKIISENNPFHHYTEVQIVLPVKINPSNMKNEIKTSTSNSQHLVDPDHFTSFSKVVLIDDDIFVQQYWEMASENIGVQLICCQTEADFLKQNFSKNTLVFIDKNLSNNHDGMMIAKKLNEEYDYQNLHLLTGEDINLADLPKHFVSLVKNKSFPKELILNTITDTQADFQLSCSTQ
jgi:signal transduction histidine kinase